MHYEADWVAAVARMLKAGTCPCLPRISMMFLIDARTLGEKPSGIGVYTLNLLRGIVAAGPDAPVTAWVRPEVLPALPAEVQRSDALRLVARAGSPASPRSLWSAGRDAGRGGFGVLHVPDVFAPMLGGPPSIVTLHDVIPLVCKGKLAKSRKQQLAWVWRRWLKVQCGRAAAVATVSAYSADDIARVLGVERTKITAIHNAVEVDGGGEEAGRKQRGPSPFSGRFILNVGLRFPYKNVDGLVRAFARMRAAEPALGDVRLVVVGPHDPRYPQAEQEAERLGLGDAVHFAGYVSHCDLAEMYRDAAVVAVPSYYEGFGLPLAEAMAAGTPAVCSNRASLPEVAGGAALVVDPDAAGALAGGLARVLNDAALADDLARRGRERAKAFGLATFGAAYLRLYERVARGAR